VLLKLERRHAKLIVPTAGLFGLYAGGFLGMGLASLRSSPWSTFGLLLAHAVPALIVGFAVMIPVDGWMGDKASHVDLLKIPLYWIATGVSLYAANWIIEKATPWALPPFVSNLSLWLAGFLAIWIDEPKS
jgi:hypothetical protein